MRKNILSLILMICVLILTGCECSYRTKRPQDDDLISANKTLLLLDYKNNYIELLDCSATKLTEDTVIRKLEGTEVKEASYSDLYIGMNNLYVKTNNDVVEEILIDNEAVFNRMRVAIRKTISNISDSSTLYHDSVTINLTSSTKIRTFDGEESWDVPENTSLEFTVSDSKITFNISGKKITSSKRVIIEDNEEQMKIASISRNSKLLYEGNLEISLKNGRLLIINDLLMDDYLKKVVPSEMVASWHIEALKTQAVAARTFAYKEIYNKSYRTLGYIVDDSESSQVYNNYNDTDATNRAVDETKGITMFYNGSPINAYFYSNNGGLQSKGNEVWIVNGVGCDIPYLQGGNETDQIVDTSSETSMLNFFKKLNMEASSGESLDFRWLITMNKSQLRQTLNTNLPLMAPSNKKSYPILENGNWVTNKSFPSDIGEISNIFVSERGTSGVIISLQIEAANVTFRIYNQYNIRFTIRPDDCGSDVTLYRAKANSSTYTSTTKNPSTLKSGFFALEWNGDNLSFYGGGWGHGVGMSQYGAKYYAEQGKIYQEILNIYYQNINLVDTSSEYTPLKDYEKYFITNK